VEDFCTSKLGCFGTNPSCFGVLPRALHWSGVTGKSPTTGPFGGGLAQICRPGESEIGAPKSHLGGC